ncbi:MAG: hypothetical protein M0037_05255 [Betaproteobacteria bacterium]|nr:hypothetical protein [Betaproteobacteria bacterium]
MSAPEVLTDTDGCRHGTELGQRVTRACEARHEQGKTRHTLARHRRQMRPARGSPSHGSRRAASPHLGDAKWNRREAKARATMARGIHTALNGRVKAKKPAVVVVAALALGFEKPKAWPSNLRQRMGDSEIMRYISWRTVKALLGGGFDARGEGAPGARRLASERDQNGVATNGDHVR